MFYLRLFALLLFSAPAAATAPYFVQCYDFGCKSTQELHFQASHWDEIRAIFDQGVVDSESERQAIRRAVALMERISGEMSGTHLDKAGNWPGYDLPRQMDCIDESTNTYQYLNALEQLDLLRWHRAGIKYHRLVWFADHWTASIREIGSERIIAVDSWYLDNGELPYLQSLDDWRRRRDFPADLNPELAAGSD